MTNRQDVISLYANQVNGVHRYNTEAFYELEAREKIFHMGRGARALDFGCGSADLLAYYARHFDEVVGVDISENMLSRASKRLQHMDVCNATLIHADDVSLWTRLDKTRFEVITSSGVMQYFSIEQIGLFLRNARAFLQPGGRVVMFDIIDPRIYWQVKYGWFADKPMGFVRILRAMLHSARVLVAEIAKGCVPRRRADLIGQSHHPASIQGLANDERYVVTFVRSMYYEYRYHAILTLNN